MQVWSFTPEISIFKENIFLKSYETNSVINKVFRVQHSHIYFCKEGKTVFSCIK